MTPVFIISVSFIQYSDQPTTKLTSYRNLGGQCECGVPIESESGGRGRCVLQGGVGVIDALRVLTTTAVLSTCVGLVAHGNETG